MDKKIWALAIWTRKRRYILFTIAIFIWGITLPQIIGIHIAEMIGYTDPLNKLPYFWNILEIIKFLMFVLLSLLLIRILTRKKITKNSFWIEHSWIKKILITSVIGFGVYAIAVYLFEKYIPWAREASNEVNKSLGMGTSLQKDILLILMVTIFAPIGEEFFFRGLFFRSVRDWLSNLNSWFKKNNLLVIIIAITISATFFASSHWGGGQDAQIYMIGLLWGITARSYRYTGSLYTPILIHSLNNSLAIYQTISQWVVIENYLILISIIGISPLIAFSLVYLLEQSFPPKHKKEK